MAATRLTYRHRNRTASEHSHDSQRTYGRFWLPRIMNGHSFEPPASPLISILSPLASPTIMTHPDEQTSAEQMNFNGTCKQPPLPSELFYRYHHHSISDSVAAGSTDSSPTTTVSTVDDSSATEPSPGSSPESPPPSSFAVNMLRPRTADESRGSFFELQKQPPPRKGRNLKNLAVDTTRHTGRAASTTSLPLQPALADPAPSIASPAFVKPPSPPKRKLSNLGLTLQTPGSSKPPALGMKLAIPPTPGFGRPGTLRHFQSSPSLPVLPGFGSQFHSQAARPARLETILSPVELSAPPQIQEAEEQNFDIPLSKEEKPEAYPDGPICVYPPYVDLYLEPTAEQCRQYDVVMNVASEVRNPLVEDMRPGNNEPEVRIDGGGGIQYAPKRPQLTIPGDVGPQHLDEPSPTTPKATPLSSSFPPEVAVSRNSKDPEYIHIPWEHNSDIVPDLLRLCKDIDERVQQKKRILVHCQCGVSRSASLVVAYGLYKNPERSVQEAYDAVKVRSKWIGPNMNLIMQLQEFRSSLARGGLLSSNRLLTPITPSSAYTDWRGPFSSNSSDPVARGEPMSASAAGVIPTLPVLTADIPAISPGPSSAPSGLKWPTNDQAPPPVPIRRTRAVSAVKRTSAYVDPAGHLIPLVQVVAPESAQAPSAPHSASTVTDFSGSSAEIQPLTSPRAAEFAMIPLVPPREVDPADDFGIMSPTSTEFATSPFDRSALLATLGMGSMHHDDAPRRALSLRSRQKPKSDSRSLEPGSERKLRGKISSPTLREQQQLQSLQTQIQASLSLSNSSPSGSDDMDDALMSPRATEFTKNPFALSLTPAQQTTKADDENSRSSMSDPRSPAHAGVSPITRNIMDVL
jgi:tyrosine-protein phosphatase MSG5